MQEIGASDRLVLRQGQGGGNHRPRRMDNGFEMGIVIVEYVGADAVDQGGMQAVEAFAAAQKVGFGFSRKRGESCNDPLHRFMPRPADRDAGVIQHRAADFALDRFRQVARLCLNDIMAKDRCDG